MNYTEKRIAQLKGLKRSKLIIALICAVVGMILLMWPQITMELVCRIIGLSLLADGIVTIIVSLVRKAGFMVPFLIAGIVIGLVGLWIFLRPAALIELLPRIVGVIIVIDGLFNLYECITMARQKTGKTLPSVMMAIATIALGCLLIFQAMGVARTVIRILGIIILYNGISDALIISRIQTKDPNAGTEK